MNKKAYQFEIEYSRGTIKNITIKAYGLRAAYLELIRVIDMTYTSSELLCNIKLITVGYPTQENI